MRVVCEFCQTVYNIPDEKLVRDTSQATCKVCKNKILIRRTHAVTPAEVPTDDPTMPRVPSATPTRISDAIPASPPAAATTEPSVSAQPVIGSVASPPEEIHETELSNSWREAIVDNRGTIDLLRKTGVSVPSTTSTAAGPAVSSPLPSDEDAPPLEIADSRRPAARAPVKPAMAIPSSSAPRSTSASAAARVDEARGSSAAIRVGGAFVSAAAAAALVHNGGWSLGLSGVAAFGACVFTALALAVDFALRRRGALAAVAIVVLAGLGSAAAAAALLATGGARTRALAAEHSFLAPFARMTARATPMPAEEPAGASTPGGSDEATPVPASSPASEDVPF